MMTRSLFEVSFDDSSDLKIKNLSNLTHNNCLFAVLIHTLVALRCSLGPRIHKYDLKD